ncbi:ubiquinol-cytochrome c reductase complex 7.3 kDa protein [Trichosporon asahii var. asahii CBS 8904]|uniref:Complex III subunit 9 n=1 Tax=Trichosporon asahii var. asahii (strain CBS 8904) TaxID=1220162 RepID=K1VT42_TRIAC|nr:ubiquinol-cytochrome c reductase complex 7.3 kDa protein [Trichosporon asahii var. asahii CBS 8904]
MDLRLQQQIYNLLFRRNSVFVPTIFIGAFAFSIGFDQITSEFWDRHNKGKQWKDIRGKYVQADEDEE